MDTTATPPLSGAVVALKPVDQAKSRLGSLPDPLRRRFAWTMALDTLAALAAGVDRLLVVGDQPALESRLRRAGLSVPVAAESGSVGMNGALSHGARLLHEQGCGLVLACVGDLPALRPSSVRRVLAAAARYPRCFLADAAGVGTTMLLARDGDLEPAFQGPSAAAHAATGAAALTDEVLEGPLLDARTDVDTEDDLVAAARLGVGPATRALLDPDTGRPGGYQSVTTTGQRSHAGTALVVTATGYRLPMPTSAVQDGLRELRPGQRLHAATAPDRVLAAWL